MNIEQAKQIPLEDFLSRIGCSPTRSDDRQSWYCSPLRDEKTPSFKVNIQRNKWYDFGSGKGGDILDLVMQLFHLDSIPNALAEIERCMGDASPAVDTDARFAPTASEKPDQTKLVRAVPIASHGLRMYLYERGLDSAEATALLQEVHYERAGKPYFAVGFKNDSSGFELRTKQFKGTFGRKDITTISGDPTRVAIFEGFSDYLTAVIRNGGLLSESVIVMNSVAMKDRTIEKLLQMPLKCVDLWLDNDDAGEELKASIFAALPDIKIVDHSPEYSNFKDLNEWHVATLSRDPKSEKHLR